MNRDKVNIAIAEAYRFIERAQALPASRPYTMHGHNFTHDNYPKEQGAIRRASMDLTRALADLRRPS